MDIFDNCRHVEYVSHEQIEKEEGNHEECAHFRRKITRIAPRDISGSCVILRVQQYGPVLKLCNIMRSALLGLRFV